MIYTRSELGGPLRQGEIVTGLVQAVMALETVLTSEPELDYVHHPFAIVLTQDCDLEQDWKARHTATDPGQSVSQGGLPTILFAEMNTAESLRGRVGASDIWKRVRQNKDERYQFLESVPPDEDALSEGLPELGIDFKRYFTIHIDEAYKRIEKQAKRRCRLVSPYLEHLSIRFFYYQFRVALPADHRSI